MSDLEAFRREVRDWIVANYPASLRAPLRSESDETPWGGRKTRYSNPDVKLWMDRMAARGWGCPDWAVEHGGAGLEPDAVRVLREELAGAGCRPAVFSFGLMMLAPVLSEFASEEQKQRFLPPIARGEIRWCQGYSEPGAGSDLASLKTRAEDGGDHWLVNGQKIWTSYADQSDWIFCLVRTNTESKHGGISFLLIDMTSPGIEVRPIRLISGKSPFCEVFFTDVRVPKENLIGKPGEGWKIAKRLLQYERTNISQQVQSGLGGTPGGLSLAELAKRHRGEQHGRIADAHVRELVARHEMQSEAIALTLRRVQEESGRFGPSATSSITKALGAQHNKDKFELMLEIMGQAALGWDGAPFEADDVEICHQWLRSKGNSIEGGTSEIQTNIVAKQVLGLPD
ncbi:MAG TPA: acyl-CoA dehydrogenase family protein [Steroidobacteraceae bacterium]|nr:acyl-CoA dehydrogenase family protein [Steroidobacteraceae bacterium]